MTPPSVGSIVVLHFAHSRLVGGDDIARVLRDNLGESADVAAEIDTDGRLTGYTLTLSFPSAEEAFDGALAIRNFMAANGLACEVR